MKVPLQDIQIAAASPDWELRQKHAAFFQVLIGSEQQGAIFANSGSAVLVTLGGVMAHFSTVGPSQDWMVLILALLGWLVLSGMLTASFSISATNVEAVYLREHAELFPNARPYRLRSFLLNFARKKQAGWRWRTWQAGPVDVGCGAMG